MTKPRFIYRSDGEWMAIEYAGNLFDTQGDWVAWLDGDEVFKLDGEYVGYISKDGRLLRRRVLPYRSQRRAPPGRPYFHPPATAPLAPLFAGISYEIIDVFEETPDVFDLVSELRPDAGEEPLPRLLEANPILAAQQRLRKVELEMLEEMVYGMIYSYGATKPPVPIEAMATSVRPENAGDVKITSSDERVQLAEQLIERLGHSAWTRGRGYCGSEGFTPPKIQYAARALLMPRHWVLKIPEKLRLPWALAQQYIVPEKVASLRLYDLR